MQVDSVGPVGDETTVCDQSALKVHCGQLVPVRQRDDQLAMKLRECTCRQNHAGVRRARERLIARSIPLASCTSIARSSTPKDGATDWIAPHWPVPEGMAASRRTATRVTGGAISLSSSSHFPLRLYSNIKKPVTLPPGLARLSTKPAPTGSTTFVNTTGTVRVAFSNGATCEAPVAKITSGVRAISSSAYLRVRSASPAPARMSI